MMTRKMKWKNPMKIWKKRMEMKKECVSTEFSLPSPSSHLHLCKLWAVSASVPNDSGNILYLYDSVWLFLSYLLFSHWELSSFSDMRTFHVLLKPDSLESRIKQFSTYISGIIFHPFFHLFFSFFHSVSFAQCSMLNSKNDIQLQKLNNFSLHSML